MNTRQRFPGNGYRSNAVPSRISPETSIRGHPIFSHSDSRNFHRPFGRMHPKSPLSVPHQVSRRGNFFIEAGRLAVDYLISHGLLPPDVLCTTSSNGNSKINDNLEFNPRNPEVADDFISPTEGQSTAPTSSEKSLLADDAYETGKRSPVHVKEKRRLSRPLSSTDLSDENGRDGSFSAKASPADVIANCNNVHLQQNAKEVDANISNSLDDGARFKQYQDEISFNCPKNNGASSVNDIAQNTDKLSSIHVEVGKQSNKSDLGEKDAGEKSTIHNSEGDFYTSRKDCDGLLKSCNSELSTKSFYSFRPADMNLVMMADGSNNICQSGSSAQFIMPVTKNLTSGSSGSSDYEISGPMDKVRGEKRSLENKDVKDNPKKLKDWPIDLHNEGSQLSVPENDRIGNQELLPLPGRVAIQAVNQDSVTTTGSMLPKGGIGISVAYSEEKRFFPGSFKICDLNLMEVSDANETHDDSTIAYSSNPVPKKDISVDIDLSMSNSCSLKNVYSKYEDPGKGVQRIDLESDPLQGDKGIHNSAERMQSGFPGLESFPNHLQNSSENPDVQDGYGLMLSEFIGTDIQNCSSAQPGVSSLQNEIGLHHGEGILSDDDQIYMSLGEIPLSLLRSWDQPPQDYDKPF